MKAPIFAFLALASIAASAQAPAPPPKPTPIHAQGCVQPGVEASCLVVKDVKSGVLYNLLVKEPRPAVGTGIEFNGVPFDGMTTCMQGTPVSVTTWARKDSIKCTPAEPVKP
jgi:hypothetical protein